MGDDKASSKKNENSIKGQVHQARQNQKSAVKETSLSKSSDRVHTTSHAKYWGAKIKNNYFPSTTSHCCLIQDIGDTAYEFPK